MVRQPVAPAGPVVADSPSRMDIDVISVLLGGFVITSVLIHLGLFRNAGFRDPALQRLLPMEAPGAASLAVASVIVVLLRTTRIVGRVAGAALFIVLAGWLAWRSWAIAAAAQVSPPASWIAQAVMRVALVLSLGGWLATCGWRAWRESRGRRTRS